MDNYKDAPPDVIKRGYSIPSPSPREQELNEGMDMIDHIMTEGKEKEGFLDRKNVRDRL